MDQERPVEKLLRQYAKRRRQQAGERFELPPATRRLLQGEIARTFRDQPGTGSWFASIFTLTRLAWGGAAVALLVVLGVAFFAPKRNHAELMAKHESRDVSIAEAPALQSSGQEKDKFAPAEAQKQPQPINLAARDNPTIEQVSPEATVPSFAPKEEKLKKQLQDELIANVPAAGLPASNSFVQGRFAGGPAPTTPLPEQNQALVRMRAAAPVGAPASSAATATTAPAPASEPQAGAAAAVTADAQAADDSHATAYFSDLTRRLGPAGSTSTPSHLATARREIAPPAAESSAVLVSFKLEQNGEQLRVIDQDGSVYTGYLLARPEPGVNVSLRSDSAPAPETRSFQTQRISPRTKGTAAAPALSQSASQNYFFSVAGTNRTLKQKVVFTGNVAPTNLSPPVGSVGGGLGGAGRPATGDWLLNSRVSGKAVVNDRQQIEIKAAPVQR